MIYVKLCY